MQFLNKKNPAIYLSETTQYVTDLQRVTLLRDRCKDAEERASYDNIIHCMQEVLEFMNTISGQDQNKTNPKVTQKPTALV
jgi:hypothetical protein